MNPLLVKNQVSIESFLKSYKETLIQVFYKMDNIGKFIQKRGFPPKVLQGIMNENPLSVGIPKKYGGRGGNIKECLGILDTSAYESLPLSLIMGINLALFIEPVAKYANQEVKADIFERFLNSQNMGGLMITEPDYGSDALNMQTYNEKIGSYFHLSGTKHWQGLTGMADYWLIASRNRLENGTLGRDIDFFICDTQQDGQQIYVEEYYNNAGLYPIPYGKNKINIKVPEAFKLRSESTGLKIMLDLLHRSRFQFPGMGMGFIRRIMDEAIKHCNKRFVAGKPLMALDQIKNQIAKIQSAFTICSAMCVRSTEVSSIENDLSGSSIEANSMKAYITDLMQDSAQIVTQLSGGNGYKLESMGSRGIIDSRPFQIFEGSNDMLYTQICEMIMKIMSRLKTFNILALLKNYELTKNVADYFKSLLNFTIDLKMPQRKIIDLGKIFSRVISVNQLVNMEAKGYREDLIKSSIETILHEVATLVSSYQTQTTVIPVEDYNDKGNWIDFC